MGAISDFVASFGRDSVKYITIEKEVKALCEQALRAQHIEFLWQSRVKATGSLEKKLRDRIDNYNDESENVADVKDLVAGRIILARWLDIEHVEKIVGQIFNVKGRAQHPKHGQNTVTSQARFRGYDGLHFHVTRQDHSDQHSYRPIIEIQVMSAFMWGFSTLEHDIEYKRLHGEPDEGLLLSLEMLKGIANTGEIALQMYDNQFFPAAKLSLEKGEFDPEKMQTSIRTVVDEVRLTEDDKICLHDLRRTDPRHDMERIKTSKHQVLEGSCSWVLDDSAFVDWWTRDDSQFLWIHGDPGKGKTMMMIALIDEVSKRLNDRPGSNVLAYFFCQNTNDELNTTVSVLRGLIYLLIDQEKKLIHHVRKRYDSAGRRLFEDGNARYALQEILLDILKDPSLGNVYFAIDALDECDPTMHDLLKWIIHTKSQTSPRIKWLTTSRNQPAFIERLGRGHQLHTSLELNSLHVARAVASFIDHKVKGLAELKLYSSELQLSVRMSLLEKSEDTFLWVALVCQELSDVRPQRVKSWLEKIPAGLIPLYERMLDQVFHQKDEDDIKSCRRILRAVVLAFRPLRLEEIAVFAEVSEDVHDLVGHCGCFITIREEIAYLVHQSAKDFLSDVKRKDIFNSGQEHEHAIIARLCLEVMSNKLKKDICDFKKPGICLGDFDDTRIETHIPLYTQYACLHWFDHLQQAGPIEQETFLSHRDCRLSEAVLIISSLCSTPRLRKNTDFFSFVNDARRFVLEFRHIVEMAPLQVYNSALVFSPKSSIIKRLFSHVIPVWIETLPVVEKAWTASLQALEGHSSSVEAILFSPNDRLLASASDNHIRLWDPVTGASRGTVEIPETFGVAAMNFSPTGQLTSVSTNKIIGRWDPITGTSQDTLKGHTAPITKILFSPNGGLLASASDDHNIRIWDPITGTLKCTFEGHTEWIHSITFSPDGQLLASSASDDNNIRLWDPIEGAVRGTLKGHSTSVQELKFSPNSQLLASGSYDSFIKLWDPVARACRGTLKDCLDWDGVMIFSPNGQLLASGSSDNTIKIWNSRGILQNTLEGHSHSITTLVFSPDGRLLVSASFDFTIRLWDPITGTHRGTLEGHSEMINAVVFSADGQCLASASSDHTIRLWEVVVEVPRGTLEGHSREVCVVTLSPGDQILASTSYDKTVKLWSSVGVLQGTFKGHTNWARAIAFSPNGQLLASASHDRTVRLWNIITKTCDVLIGHKDEVNTVIFSPNEWLLASASRDRTIRLWNSVTGECRGTLEGHTDFINAIVFSPNGQLLASGDEHIIRLWNPFTGALQGTLEGYSSPISAIIFSLDGQHLASTHHDYTIRLWNIRKRTLVQQCESNYGQNISIRQYGSELDIDGRLLEKFGHTYSKSLSFQHDEFSEPRLYHKPLQISSSLYDSPHDQGVADASYALDFKKEWVTCKGRRVLWLPLNYRPGVYFLHNHTLVLGNASGRVTLLRFSMTIPPS
ncbi:MAG: hypothetical protein ASARMPREDX12_006774 [Alectoria sarmentosa]|nr:MAG: hypothetical protein ASARMPREDX12_006774 [Alectoria sarmentosa]